MKRLSAMLGLLMVLLLSMGTPVDAFPTRDPCRPTDEQLREIERWRALLNSLQAGYEALKGAENSLREAGLPGHAAATAAQAEAWKQMADSVARRLLELIDEYYCIDPPPDTTYKYDPDSQDYAYVPGNSTKDDKTVIFCPIAFGNGADLAASVKLHELRHAWQVHNCWSSQPGFWGDCTFWGHLAEFDAYSAEERAYDARATRRLPRSEKDLIRQRIREHRRAMFRRIGAHFPIDFWTVSAGEIVPMPVVLFSTLPEPVEVTVNLENDFGWPILPPPGDLPPFIIGGGMDSETEVIEFSVQVPPDAHGQANAFTLTLVPTEPIDGPDPHDIGFVQVANIPFLEVFLPDETVTGSPGDSIPIEIEFLSLAPLPRTIQIDFGDVLGWPINPEAANQILLPGEQTTLEVTLDVPEVVDPYELNILRLTITDTDNPTAPPDTSTIPIEIVELQLRSCAPITVRSPGPVVPASEEVDVTVDVLNFSRWAVDSFFDITYTITGPGGNAVYDERVTTSAPFAPLEMRTIEFPPAVFVAPGTYTLLVHAPEESGDPGSTNPVDDPTEAYPLRNVLVLEFEVVGPEIEEAWSIY